MNTTKKLLSLVLCLAMMFSVCNVRIFAEEETAEKVVDISEAMFAGKIEEEPEIQTEVPAGQNYLAASASGTCGKNLTWTLDENGTLTISGSGKMNDYTWLSSAPWDDYSNNIKTVVIDNGVTSIGGYAFAWCDSLTTVTIPEGVTSIGYDAFYWCRSLNTVTIPSSVTSIGYYAFGCCSSLTTVTIPSSVTSIDNYSFGDCYSLTAITVDKNNPNYSSDERGVLFNKDKTQLIKYPVGNTAASYDIPSSVTSIGDLSFASCSRLTTVTIPSSMTSIGNSAFKYCLSLTTVTMPPVSQVGTTKKMSPFCKYFRGSRLQT